MNMNHSFEKLPLLRPSPEGQHLVKGRMEISPAPVGTKKSVALLITYLKYQRTSGRETHLKI